MLVQSNISKFLFDWKLIKNINNKYFHFVYDYLIIIISKSILNDHCIMATVNIIS